MVIQVDGLRIASLLCAEDVVLMPSGISPLLAKGPFIVCGSTEVACGKPLDLLLMCSTHWIGEHLSAMLLG